MLEDEDFLQKGLRIIDEAIALSQEDGFIGAEELKKPDCENQWPHAVLFRSLLAHYSYTEDMSYINAMERHYLTDYCDYSKGREVVNIESILGVYNVTGNKALLDLAVKGYEKFNETHGDYDSSVAKMQSEDGIAEHGVTFNEVAKLAAIMYMNTGQDEYLQAVEHCYHKVDQRYMLASGVHSSSEELNSNTSDQAHETCDIVDYTWSMGYLLMATGNVKYADKIEKACFNAGFGAIGPDFKTIEYFSAPNQVLATKNSNFTDSYAQTPRFAYQPHHYPECCVGNVNRLMPNYISRMWMTDEEDSIIATLYGPSAYEHSVADGQTVRITEETAYPFSEDINFKIETDGEIDFTLKLRIPQWCLNASLRMNNEKLDMDCKPGTFISIKRTFKDGDEIVLHLPMKVTTVDWPGNGVSIERGPIVYSLDIKEEWEKDLSEPRQTEDFPAWNVRPGSPWNYGLVLDEENDISVSTFDHAITWEKEGNYPCEIYVTAKKISNWNLEMREKVSKSKHLDKMESCGATIIPAPYECLLPIPEIAEPSMTDEKETIKLIPYGFTHLRVTVFPRCQ